MKRTSLMLDESLLKTAKRLLGEKTYSATVNRVLEETIKLVRIRRLSNFAGSKVWEGDLSRMREDRKAERKK